MSDTKQLYERLQAAEARLVARLGMETATIAIENIDIEFYSADYFLLQYAEELVRKYFPFPGSIHGSIATSRNMSNAKRAFTLLCINQLSLKKRQVAALLHSGIRNVYNKYTEGINLLDSNAKNNPFKQRYNMILHEFQMYQKTYNRNGNLK